jgi:hypothetical protein
VKYIVFWEFCPEDIDKVIKNVKTVAEDREKHPDKYPKSIFPSHEMGGKTKGFEIIEATPQQLIADINSWLGLVTLKFVPILKSSKVIEDYLKSK